MKIIPAPNIGRTIALVIMCTIVGIAYDFGYIGAALSLAIYILAP